MTPCPDSWHGHGSSCYLYDDNYMTWEEAEAACGEEAAYVTSIGSQEENDLVWKDIGKTGCKVKVRAVLL